jgi:hypothetical protein
MIKFLGMFTVFLACYGLSIEFDLKLVGQLIFGILLICSEGLFSHVIFVEREKVRSEYRSRR